MAGKERGSDKLLARLFGEAASEEQLGKAVAEARDAGYRITRWWWYGQPAIEQINATLQVEAEAAGATAASLVQSHSSAAQINFDVFPYGIPAVEGVEINVMVRRNLQKIPGQ